MQDVENILGEEKIFSIAYNNEDIIYYIKSFKNVLFCDYSYKDDMGSLVGLFVYEKERKYFYIEFVLSRENGKYNKLAVNDYSEYITSSDYDLTFDKFNDVLNIDNIKHEQFINLIRRIGLKNIKCLSLKKIDLKEYAEIYPNRYINNRFKFLGRDNIVRINVENIVKDLVYRCPYCGSTKILRILDENSGRLEGVNVYELNDLYDDENLSEDFFICGLCNLVIRNPKDVLDYI